MNIAVARIFVVLSVMVPFAAYGNPSLAKTKDCMACHFVDQKVIGPSFQQIAKRYAGQQGAEDALTQKVLHGGTGSWGSVPMPSNNQVSAAEAKLLVKWVLKQK